ncbi:protein sel-1 homolog 1-like isoform X2 [Clytia hemisphaerica]|uniref:protein sel-1 homolog 1-like isoform X2 n=1 Tax=Clytia hemisphaerica TaxID=252671 RepID=UPI0034D62CCF
MLSKKSKTIILFLVLISVTRSDAEEKEDTKDEREGKKAPSKPISTLKVVKENVSGDKFSSFSEDKDNNRDDEQTVSDIRKEAESIVVKKNSEARTPQEIENEAKSILQGDSETPDSQNKESTDSTSHESLASDTASNIEDIDSDLLNSEEDNVLSESVTEETVDNTNEDDSNVAEKKISQNEDVGSPPEGQFKNTPEKEKVEQQNIINQNTASSDKESTPSMQESAEQIDDKNINNEEGTAKENNLEPERMKVDNDGNIFTETEESERAVVDFNEEINPELEEDFGEDYIDPEEESFDESGDDGDLEPEMSTKTEEKTNSKAGEKVAKKEEEIEIKKEEVAEEQIALDAKAENEEQKPTKDTTDKELEALYREAKNLPKTEQKKRNRLLLSVAEKGHLDSMADIGYPLLFGDEIKANISKAFQMFQKLAEEGLPKGQQGLGFLHGTGLHGNSSQAKSIIYTTFAALGGDTMAEMMLGYRHYSGIGVQKSCETALTYYKKVAKKVSDAASLHSGGNAVQRIRLYDELEQPGGNAGHIDEDLLQYYQFLADKGDTQAQIGLGQLFFQGGRGIDINYERAFHYFKKAADNENGNGLAYIGKMYMQGLHVQKDSDQAFHYFKKSLESKNPIGQAGLGMLYLKGEGVKKDYDEALKYFSQSAEQGWVEGQLQLGNMYYNGIGVKKDYRQAVKYFTFASQSGHVLAFYNLAMMHTIGAGVMRSCNAATELFKNVAERGNWSMMFMDAHDAYKDGDLKTALIKYYFLAELGYEVAQSNVAYILDKDETNFFDKNETYSRALLQWSRAAEQGYAIARVKVGDYYFYGLGTKVNYEMAALQYRLASDKQANAQAMFNLGFMHEQGFGLKKDIHLAKRFYDMAAEASVDAQFPVYLALAKLALEFSYEWLMKNYRFWEQIDTEKMQLYVVQKVGPDWDIYVITALTGLLGLLLLFRRALRR